MTKMTVTYAVFVMALCARRWYAGTPASRRSPAAPSCSAALAVGRDAPLRQRGRWSARRSPLVRRRSLAALGDIAGGLPVAGSLCVRRLLGRPRAWSAPGSAAVACQLSASARTCGGDRGRRRSPCSSCCARSATPPRPPGSAGSRRSAGRPGCGPGRDPRGWVLLLYLGLAAAAGRRGAASLRGRRDLGSGLLRRPARAGRPVPPARRRARARPRGCTRRALAVWTRRRARRWAALMGAIAPGVGDLLDSAGAREMFERTGRCRGAAGDLWSRRRLDRRRVVGHLLRASRSSAHGGRRRARRPHRAGARHRHLALAAFAAPSRSSPSPGSPGCSLVTGLAMAVGARRREVAPRRCSRAALAQLAGGLGRAPALALLALALRSRVGACSAGLLVVAFFVLGPLGRAAASCRAGWPGLSPYSHVPRCPPSRSAGRPSWS